jgi:uroporphyrinogen-III synthase
MSESPAPRVLNTRPEGQNAELSAALRKNGFDPVEVPLVAITVEEEGIARLRKLPPTGFTGIFLSSPNGLRQMEAGLDPAALARWTSKPFFLVGPKARTLVENLGGKVAFVPSESSLKGFLAEFKVPPGPAGLPMSQRWLHPCSASTRVDPSSFRARGVEIENLPVYLPAFPKNASARLREAEGISAALFCSASAVEHFFKAASEDSIKALGAPKGVLAVSIGPSTTEALHAKGVENVQEAPHADNNGLLDALRRAYGGAETKVLKKSPAAGSAAAGTPGKES